MNVTNDEVASRFTRLADLLEIQGANPFRVRAYRNAARVIEGMTHQVRDLVDEDRDLTDISGIGPDLAEKIETLVETGELPVLDQVERELPGSLSELLEVEMLGPKRASALYRELDVQSLEDLRRAAESGDIARLEGFGEKTQKKILREVDRVHEAGKRMRISRAAEYAEDLAEYLREVKGVKRVTVAGSYRRRKETVGDLDILVTCKRGTDVMDRFTDYPRVQEVVSKGKTRSTVRLKAGLQVDVRVVPEASYGAALHYFTGSKSHNVAVRQRGVKRGYKINEYGVYRNDRKIAGRTEKEVYGKVGLPWIEPELRENRGEIECAGKDKLPKLVRLGDLRGDLHAHTRATDGQQGLRQMAEAAREQGHDYLAITDHSKRVSMAHGLDEKRLRKQIDQVDRLNEKLDGITLLKAIEVDILKDGSLDLPESVLRRLDLTVCSVHYHFGLSRRKQTERLIRAMDNSCFNILGHPSGRLLQQREGYAVDLEKVMEAAAERGCFLELNAQPERLDLRDRDCMLAKEIGVKVAISSDAHSRDNLSLLPWGVDQARRGWLTKDDVINTRSLKGLRRLLKR